MKTVTLIKDYVNENGNVKKAGVEITVLESKIKELAAKGVIETDKRFKTPKRSKIIIENTNIEK